MKLHGNAKIRILTITFLVAILSACGSGPQNLIVGKWEVQNAPTKMIAEFRKDGTADLSILGQTLHGTYKVTADNELEWAMNGISSKHKISVTADKLEVSDEENRTIVYKRK